MGLFGVLSGALILVWLCPFQEKQGCTTAAAGHARGVLPPCEGRWECLRLGLLPCLALVLVSLEQNMISYCRRFGPPELQLELALLT